MTKKLLIITALVLTTALATVPARAAGNNLSGEEVLVNLQVTRDFLNNAWTVVLEKSLPGAIGEISRAVAILEEAAHDYDREKYESASAKLSMAKRVAIESMVITRTNNPEAAPSDAVVVSSATIEESVLLERLERDFNSNKIFITEATKILKKHNVKSAHARLERSISEAERAWRAYTNKEYKAASEAVLSSTKLAVASLIYTKAYDEVDESETSIATIRDEFTEKRFISKFEENISFLEAARVAIMKAGSSNKAMERLSKAETESDNAAKLYVNGDFKGTIKNLVFSTNIAIEAIMIANQS